MQVNTATEPQYRPLTGAETAQLERQGNWCDDWTMVRVADPFSAECLRGNTFDGPVRLGPVTPTLRSHGTLTLREGVYHSTLSHCTLGAHPAVHHVGMLDGYTVGDNATLAHINEMTCCRDPRGLAWLEPMNENGGRRMLPFAGMTVGDAYLWARYRGRRRFTQRLEAFTREWMDTVEGRHGVVGDNAVVINTGVVRNVAILSAPADRTVVDGCVALSDGVVGYGCTLESGVIAARFLLGEHVHLEFGLRLNDSVVGDNSTLARCEVGNSLIFPAHEQHHNNSFLIAALVMGQSNVAAGGTLGSNHNSRTADNELAAGRGFWPGLCCSLKHSSRFASYCLLAKGDYPSELDIRLPFALVNNNASLDRLEVMPAYWWMYNMYALDRNSRKFARRDRRVAKAQHIEFAPLAPDTAEEILAGMALLRQWLGATTDGTVRASGMEHSKRPTVILKAQEGLRAYEQMLVCYAMQRLTAEYGHTLPPAPAEVHREWVNIGGQLVTRDDMEQLIADVESGAIGNWRQLHERMDALWQAYPTLCRAHAYRVLCLLADTEAIDAKQWQAYLDRYADIQTYITEQIAASRHKDEVNPFRRMTYWDDDERAAVLE